MGTSDHGGHAVTEPFRDTTGKSETERAERPGNPSQGLADLTTVFRSVLAKESDPDLGERQTIQFGSPPAAAAKQEQEVAAAEDENQEDESQEAIADDLILQTEILDSEILPRVSKRELADSPESQPKNGPPPTADVAEQEIADDVDDLNSYMESFLQRMRVNPASTPANETAAEKTPSSASQEKDQTSQRSYSGPKTAPECKSDMAVMRQLANETTKVSLSAHAAHRCKQVTRLMCVSAVTSVICGIVAFSAPTVHSYSYITALALFGVSVFTAWRAWAGVGQLVKATRSSGKSPPLVQSADADHSMSKA